MPRSPIAVLRNLATATFLISASCATVMADELRWHFRIFESTAQTFLSDCTDCDGAVFSAICTKGEAITLIPQMNVEGGKAGERRNVTFLFGDGAVDVRGELVANEIDDTIEPVITVRTDHEILQLMQEFERVEIMVHSGPSVVISLTGTSSVFGKLRSFCGS